MDTSQKNILMQMTKLNKAMFKAQQMKGKSVIYLRKDVLEEAVITLTEDPNAPLTLFGVKDTNQIDLNLVKRLQSQKGFLFHTVDKMSERGRAIDVDLVNPLTGRVMTGSSSGSCVNILRGINDFAIGTDGGGSVLAPATSTGLFSIMAKGLGIKGNSTRISTDNISFTPGIGVISHNYSLCKKVIQHLCDIKDFNNETLLNRKIKIAIPKEGSLILPNGRDMRSVLNNVVLKLDDISNFIEKDFSGIQDRRRAIDLCKDIFNDNIDIIITAEGPIDIYGLGDSVLGTWGEVGADIQNSSGKYLLKVANMIDSTAITIPTGDLGIGILIIAKKGVETGKLAIELGQIISKLYKSPKLFRRYFIEGYKRGDFGFF